MSCRNMAWMMHIFPNTFPACSVWPFTASFSCSTRCLAFVNAFVKEDPGVFAMIESQFVNIWADVLSKVSMSANPSKISVAFCFFSQKIRRKQKKKKKDKK